MRLTHRLLPALTCLLACLLACLPACAAAETRENLEVSYYDVPVHGGESLGRQVRAVSPLRQPDRVSFGHTDWHVDWRMRWNTDGAGQCRFTSVQVDLRGAMLLPRLIGASPRQGADFERFMEALRRHETGHYDHGRQAAREVEQALLAMPPMPGCGALEAEGSRRARAIVERFADMDVRYDRETDHGRTQGAYLP